MDTYWTGIGLDDVWVQVHYVGERVVSEDVLVDPDHAAETGHELVGATHDVPDHGGAGEGGVAGVVLEVEA